MMFGSTFFYPVLFVCLLTGIVARLKKIDKFQLLFNPAPSGVMREVRGVKCEL